MQVSEVGFQIKMDADIKLFDPGLRKVDAVVQTKLGTDFQTAEAG